MKAHTTSSKKAKGRRLELRLAQLIRESGLDPQARRMVGSGAFEGFKTDQFNKLPFSFECKNQETVSIWKWWEQTQNQATIAKPPVLVFSGNFKPILATLKIETFLDLLKEIDDLRQLLLVAQTKPVS